MIVYLLVNQVNHKGYVGQHVGDNLTKRWNAQLTNASKTGHLAAAIKKYGAEAFSREILSHCATRVEADNLEKLWIGILRTFDPRCGYNVQMGGRGMNARHIDESRKKIATARRKYWDSLSDRQREAFSEKMRLMWRMRTAKQRKRICQKISQSMVAARRRMYWVAKKHGRNACLL